MRSGVNFTQNFVLYINKGMDFTHFIAHQDEIEPALKSGLYIVQQSHLPLNLQAFRCGLAGKPSDAAQRAFQGKQSSFASRFATYLNYWLPTNAKVFAVLTVPRRIRAGFSDRVLSERQEGDNREDYAPRVITKHLFRYARRSFIHSCSGTACNVWASQGQKRSGSGPSSSKAALHRPSVP